MSSSRLRFAAAGIALAAGFGICSSANADLTVTAAGQGLGFDLTTFATLNPGITGGGSFGVAVASNGNVIVSNLPNATRYSFADVDGQTVASALSSRPSNSSTAAYASAGGQAYGNPPNLSRTC